MESSYYYLLAKMVALLRFINALKFRQLLKTRRFTQKLNLKKSKKFNFFALFSIARHEGVGENSKQNFNGMLNI